MSAGAAAGAAAAAIAQAIKASGVLVRIEPDEFIKIASRMKAPLVVAAKGGFLRTYYAYLTSYKGLAFYSRSSVPLQLPADAELVYAGGIWVPG